MCIRDRACSARGPSAVGGPKFARRCFLKFFWGRGGPFGILARGPTATLLRHWWRHLVIATDVTAGLEESNGSLPPGLWRDSVHVICLVHRDQIQAQRSVTSMGKLHFTLLGPFYGAIAVPSVTRCRCRCRCGHRFYIAMSCDSSDTW